MPLFVRNAGVWTQFPTLPTSGCILPVRTEGEWLGANKVWVRDANTWKQEPEYLGKPSAPTSFRVTSATNDYYSVWFEWNYSGPVTPKQFRLTVYDYGAKTTNAPVIREYLIDPTARFYQYLTNDDTYVSATICAETSAGNRMYFGGTETSPGAAKAPRWKTGHAPYDTYDIPVYGWGDEIENTPPLTFASSYYTAGTVGGKAVDNNMSTSWVCAPHSGRGTSNDWEGIWVKMPTGHYNLTGVRIIQEPTESAPVYTAVGIYYSNAWRGTIDYSLGMIISSPPVHSYIPHAYMGYFSVARDQYIYSADIGSWVTDGGTNPGGNQVAITMGPNFASSPNVFGYYCGLREVRLLIRPWQVIYYNPTHHPAVASAAW